MFYPEGYDKVHNKRKLNTAFTIFSWLFALTVLLAPIYLTSLRSVAQEYNEKKNSEEEKILGVREMEVNAEKYFISYKDVSGLEVSDEEKRKVVRSVSSQIHSGDYRELVLRAYLETMKCSNGDTPPLADHTRELVRYADESGLDYKITTAIAGVESWFGCAGGADEIHNAWGYGGGISTRFRYSNWDEGIREYSKGLAEGYGTNIHERVREIASFYVTGQAGEHNGWAEGVLKYMNGIEWVEGELKAR